MKKRGLIVICFSVILIAGYFYWVEYINPVSFNDANLKHALLEDIRYNGKQELSKNDLKRLEGHLSLSNKWIKDLEGIQYCSNIESIDLSRNQIENIAPLFELTNIEELYLDRTRIKNLTGIENLKNLTKLDLSTNKLDDINEIEDISSLNNLGNLNQINLSNNLISTTDKPQNSK